MRVCAMAGGKVTPPTRLGAQPDVPDPDDLLNDSGFTPNDERPPICPVCGVTMVPAEFSALGSRDHDWVCLECEETAEAGDA